MHWMPPPSEPALDTWHGGKSHESAVWAYAMDGVSISLTAFEAARKYEDNDIPEAFKQSGLLQVCRI